MLDSRRNLPRDLGQTLAKLRDDKGLTQADIARSLNIDQSRVSRIEKGNVIPTTPEIEGILSTVGTENAKAYGEFLEMRWDNIDRPSFWHPQRDALCKAETYLQKLENFKSKPKVLKQQINEADFYGDTILREAKYLTDLNHSIAYVGKIAVGKTTAICKLTGLFNPQESKFNRQSILATAKGRTTACEVRIRGGEKFGFIVHPQSQEEINKVIEDFWAVWKGSTEENADNQKTDVSWEIERALRNMIKSAADDIESEDPLLDIVNQCENLDTFRLEVFERLKLSDKQKVLERYFEDTSEQTNLEELKEMFKTINYSRDKDIPLPQRIELFVPVKFLPFSPYDLEFIDTRGVDVEGTTKGSILRQDLIDYLDDPRSLTVLCCNFDDAPGEVIYNFIDSLIETRQKAFKERVVLLILAHNNEALETKDNTGEDIETEAEAYKQKQDEVERKLKKLQQKCNDAINIPIIFFNASSNEAINEPAKISNELIKRLEQLRASRFEQIVNAADALDILIKDVEEKNAREAHQEVIKRLKNYLKQNRNLSEQSRLIHDYLLEEMKKAHQRQVLATTRRRGHSNSFNVYVLLAKKARDISWYRSYEFFSEVKGIIKSCLADSELKPAHSFLEQLNANWGKWREYFLKYSEQTAKQLFQYRLEYSFNWAECVDEYGKEGKFRDKVIEKLREWFEDPEQADLHDIFNSRIEKVWQEQVLAQLRRLTDDGVEI
ncbi:MAG TPA: helix-turn-helix transcriptional regulator [Candidatus Obscuribacterales bacterium]